MDCFYTKFFQLNTSAGFYIYTAVITACTLILILQNCKIYLYFSLCFKLIPNIQ